MGMCTDKKPLDKKTSDKLYGLYMGQKLNQNQMIEDGLVSLQKSAGQLRFDFGGY